MAVGSIPREQILKMYTWMHCKSLWINTSAKCINVNVKMFLKGNWQRVDPEPSGDVRRCRPHWQAWQWHFVKRSDPLSRSQRGSSHWSMVSSTGQDRARKSEGMKSKKSKHTVKHTSEELVRRWLISSNLLQDFQGRTDVKTSLEKNLTSTNWRDRH